MIIRMSWAWPRAVTCGRGSGDCFAGHVEPRDNVRMTPLEAPVEIVPYDSSWPRQFVLEAEILRRALAPWLVGPIEHIGSLPSPDSQRSQSSIDALPSS